MQAHLKTSILYCEKYRFLKFLLSPLQPTEWFFFCLVCHMLVDYRKIEKPWKMHRLVGWSGESDKYFFRILSLKFWNFWNFQKNSGGPKNPEIIQKLCIFEFTFWQDHWKILFCPKGTITAKSDKWERAWEKLTLTFGPYFFSWPLNIYLWVPKKFGRKTQS